MIGKSFFSEYENAYYGQHVVECRDDYLPSYEQVCLFSPKWIEHCHSSDGWNYPNGSPCVILKMNKVKFYFDFLYKI